jgi:hypothetical protein
MYNLNMLHTLRRKHILYEWYWLYCGNMLYRQAHKNRANDKHQALNNALMYDADVPRVTACITPI